MKMWTIGSCFRTCNRSTYRPEHRPGDNKAG